MHLFLLTETVIKAFMLLLTQF